MLGNVASTYGSFLYPATEGPRYVKGGAVMAGISFLCAVMALVIRYIMKYENRKLEKSELEDRGKDVETNAGVREVNGFRYIT